MKDTRIFTLIVFFDGTIVSFRSKPYKHFSAKYLKAWVLNTLRKEEEVLGQVLDFEVYEGESNDFADWYDLEPIYLDIS